MRRFLAGGLSLALGLWTNGAQAEEVPPVASLGRPIAIPSPTANSPKGQPFSDPQIKPAGFSPSLIGPPRPLARAQSSESPQPMPVGPVLNDSPLPQSRQSPSDSTAPAETLGPPRLVPVPQTITPPAVADDAVEVNAGAPPCDSADCGIACDPCTGPARWGLFRRWSAFPEDTNRFWFRGEYLLWWTKETPVPPLVTTSPPGTPRDFAGVLGAPGTAILYSGDGNPERSGGRFTLGFWFDDQQTIGLESTTLFIGQRSMTFVDVSGGVPILARPFNNVLTGMEASELVAFPGVLAGGIAVSSANRLWSTELNLRTNCWRGCFWHVDWLLGVRFLGFDENLGITEGLTVPAGAGALAGSRIVVQDSFGTHNQFVGGQTGLDIGFRRGRWSLDLLGKIALGNTHQELNINGSTQFAVPGLPLSVQRGGLYALPTNIGEFTRDRFAVVPEVGIIVGYQITPHVRAIVGYTFLYNSAVIRPGSQIDRGINVTQLPSQVGPGTLVGPARPAPILHGTDFWAQGLSFGLELRY